MGNTGFKVFTVIVFAAFAFLVYQMIGIVGGVMTDASFREKAETVSGVCERCWAEKRTHKNGSHHYQTEVYYIAVKYQYAGKTYHNDRIYSERKLRSGDSVRLYVHPDNPSDSRLNMPGTLDYLPAALIFLPFLIVTGVCAFRIIRYYLSGQKGPLPVPQIPVQK